MNTSTRATDACCGNTQLANLSYGEHVDTSELFDGYGPVAGFDEMFEGTEVRPSYDQVHTSFETMGADEVRLRADSLASSYLEQGVTFGVEGEERPFRVFTLADPPRLVVDIAD